MRYDASIGVVVSGAKGRSEALAVQRNVGGALYVTDPRRKDQTVDIVLGSDFKTVTSADKVRKRNGPLVCLPDAASKAEATTSPAPAAPSSSKK